MQVIVIIDSTVLDWHYDRASFCFVHGYNNVGASNVGTVILLKPVLYIHRMTYHLWSYVSILSENKPVL